ncbi:MAG: zf-HC2 domain-containing protein [Chloroflexota bacterium]
MIEHVTEWLSAYLDGELHGLRLRQVEIHLTECAVCHSELVELRKLSSLLQETVPTDAFTPVERFAANLTLILPRRPEIHQYRLGTEIVWWLVPVALLGIWLFTQTVLSVSAVVSGANLAGLFGNATSWLQSGPQHTEWFMATFSMFGSNLNGNVSALLGVLDNLSVLQLSFIAQLAWQAAIAVLYLGWLAFWWAHRRTTANLPFPQAPSHL